MKNKSRPLEVATTAATMCCVVSNSTSQTSIL